jgi:hypothetical protein
LVAEVAKAADVAVARFFYYRTGVDTHANLFRENRQSSSRSPEIAQ